MLLEPACSTINAYTIPVSQFQKTAPTSFVSNIFVKAIQNQPQGYSIIEVHNVSPFHSNGSLPHICVNEIELKWCFNRRAHREWSAYQPHCSFRIRKNGYRGNTGCILSSHQNWNMEGVFFLILLSSFQANLTVCLYLSSEISLSSDFDTYDLAFRYLSILWFTPINK